MRLRTAFIVAVALVSCTLVAAAQAPVLPIGAIQGNAADSPYLNRFVNFRGVVVGRYEDQNTRGDVYYTLFVQSLPDEADGDPATSDGIAVFLGRAPRPDVALGDRVTVGGKVTEFYGLTEIDDRGLTLAREEDGPLPAPVPLDPPAGLAEAATYFEGLEGMRVAYEGEVTVAGPTHEGCGFAVAGAPAELPILRRADDDPTGHAVPVLYPSDLNCADIPQVKTGDRLSGLAGVLTYNFDQFKIIFDSADPLAIQPTLLGSPASPPALTPEQISIVTINAEDYFDTVRDTAEEGEVVLSADELVARQAKFVHLIAQSLACPTLVALQEVEHEALLLDLAGALAGPCGFTYQVTHRESPDARGIDNALLSDPRRVQINDVALRQTCSAAPTDVTDPTAACSAGQYPLFGRPPLQIEADIDGAPYTLYVNHFKSKRDGEIDTDLQRIQQAVYLNGLAAERLAADPAARLVALGDFNDTELSPALALLTDPAQDGVFASALAAMPPAERYTYNFGGVAELIDAVLLSPALASEVGLATILHANTDYPAGWRLDASSTHPAFRATDHDAPLVVLGRWPATPTPVSTSTAVPQPSLTPAPTSLPPTPTPLPSPSPTVPLAPTTPAPAGDSPGLSPSRLVWGFLAGALVLGALILIRRARS